MISSKLADVGPALGSFAPSLENTLESARSQRNWFVGGRPMRPAPFVFSQKARRFAASVALRWTSSSVKFELTSHEFPRNTWSWKQSEM